MPCYGKSWPSPAYVNQWSISFFLGHSQGGCQAPRLWPANKYNSTSLLHCWLVPVKAAIPKHQSTQQGWAVWSATSVKTFALSQRQRGAGPGHHLPALHRAGPLTAQQEGRTQGVMTSLSCSPSDYVRVGWLVGGTSLMVQWVKNLSEMQETQEMLVRSLGQEDPLEEEMATHSSILAWKSPWRG